MAAHPFLITCSCVDCAIEHMARLRHIMVAPVMQCGTCGCDTRQCTCGGGRRVVFTAQSPVVSRSMRDPMNAIQFNIAEDRDGLNTIRVAMDVTLREMMMRRGDIASWIINELSKHAAEMAKEAVTKFVMTDPEVMKTMRVEVAAAIRDAVKKAVEARTDEFLEEVLGEQ